MQIDMYQGILCSKSKHTEYKTDTRKTDSLIARSFINSFESWAIIDDFENELAITWAGCFGFRAQQQKKGQRQRQRAENTGTAGNRRF